MVSAWPRSTVSAGFGMIQCRYVHCNAFDTRLDFIQTAMTVVPHEGMCWLRTLGNRSFSLLPSFVGSRARAEGDVSGHCFLGDLDSRANV